MSLPPKNDRTQRSVITLFPNPQSRKRISPEAWESPRVFAGRNGSHITTIRRPWKIFKKRVGLEDFVIHDLRRTHATKMGEQGADPRLIQLSLGHERDSAATEIYNRAHHHDELAAAISAAMSALLRTGKVSQKKLLGPARP